MKKQDEMNVDEIFDDSSREIAGEEWEDRCPGCIEESDCDDDDFGGHGNTGRKKSLKEDFVEALPYLFVMLLFVAGAVWYSFFIYKW